MLLALAGAAGSGKDSIADILVSEFNYAKLSFATPLRSLALLNPEYARSLDMHGGYENAKRNDPKVREYLIALGEGIRSFEPDYFANALAAQLDTISHGNVVITDLRKENEYAVLHDWGFVFAHVRREGTYEEGLDWIESEGALSPEGWITINNGGSLDQLKHGVRQLANTSHWARRAAA